MKKIPVSKCIECKHYGLGRCGFTENEVDYRLLPVDCPLEEWEIKKVEQKPFTNELAHQIIISYGFEQLAQGSVHYRIKGETSLWLSFFNFNVDIATRNDDGTSTIASRYAADTEEKLRFLIEGSERLKPFITYPKQRLKKK